MKALLFGLLLGLSATTSYAQIKRADTLECGLSNGGKFILRSTYQWYPQARVMPGDGAERMEQSDFEATYVAGKNRISVGPLLYQPVEDFADEICSVFGLKNGLVFVGGSSYLNEREIVPIVFDKKLQLHSSLSRNSSEINSLLYRYKAFPGAATLTRKESQLIREQALIEKDSEQIVAVFKAVSRDGGKTWGDPAVSTHADIFEIGKEALEQCFIARPIKVNGKKIAQTFPQCKQ